MNIVFSCFLLALAAAILAMPAHAQFPSSLEEQLQYGRDKQEAAEAARKKAAAEEAAKAPNAVIQDEAAPSSTITEPVIPPKPVFRPNVLQPQVLDPRSSTDPRPAASPLPAVKSRGVDPRSYGSANTDADAIDVAPVVEGMMDVVEDELTQGLPLPLEDEVTGAICAVAKPVACKSSLSLANNACETAASTCARIVATTEDQACAVIRCDTNKARCMKMALDQYITCMTAALDTAVIEKTEKPPVIIIDNKNAIQKVEP